jgi:hypothetical protein
MDIICNVCFVVYEFLYYSLLLLFKKSHQFPVRDLNLNYTYIYTSIDETA